MKSQCIIFVMKNNKNFLIENIEKINQLTNHYDVIFVVRESSEEINQILNLNKLINIELTYDPGYYEALKSGFEFVKNLKYKSIIEFGECGKISLDEIDHLNEINKESDYEKSVIFASRYHSNNKKWKRKLYIYLSTGVKIYDPYSRFRIYNESTFEIIKNDFIYKINPQEFINLLYKRPNFTEVRTKCSKEHNSWKNINKNISRKFDLFIFSIFVLPYIKKFGVK